MGWLALMSAIYSFAQQPGARFDVNRDAVERPAEKAAPPGVEVHPLAGAITLGTAQRELAQPVAERASVRPLQDRPAPVGAESTARITEVSQAKPIAASPSVIGSQPAVPAAVKPPAPSETTAAPAALKFDIDR